MNVLQIIVACAFLCIGIYISFMNWGVVVCYLVRGKHSSWVPFLGGSFAAIGIAILPYSSLRLFWWIPLVLDFGCLPGLTYTIGHFGWYYLSDRKTQKKQASTKDDERNRSGQE